MQLFIHPIPVRSLLRARRCLCVLLLAGFRVVAAAICRYVASSASSSSSLFLCLSHSLSLLALTSVAPANLPGKEKEKEKEEEEKEENKTPCARPLVGLPCNRVSRRTAKYARSFAPRAAYAFHSFSLPIVTTTPPSPLHTTHIPPAAAPRVSNTTACPGTRRPGLGGGTVVAPLVKPANPTSRYGIYTRTCFELFSFFFFFFSFLFFLSTFPR